MRRSLFAFLLISVANPAVWAQAPACEQVREACKDAGFVQGGAAGERLVLDCFNPVVLGEMPRRGPSRPLPKIPKQVVAACKESLSKPVAAAPGSAPLVARDDGRTVEDAHLGVTWLADANLAARQTFGVPGINRDGAMDHATAAHWVDALNRADGGRGYLGHKDWGLPETGPQDESCSMRGTTGYGCTSSALGSLFYRGLGLRPGESVVAPSEALVGPFYNVQPYLYWACAGQSAASPCRAEGPADGFEWNFSLGNGFQGTNLVGNELFVMVYYPSAAAAQ